MNIEVNRQQLGWSLRKERKRKTEGGREGGQPKISTILSVMLVLLAVRGMSLG